MVEGATVPAWRRYRVGMVVPDYSDACSFYRSYGPWSRLAKHYPIELVHLEKASWVELAQLDLVYLGRPYLEVHAGFAELARLNGVPVWVDFDDLLTGVPESNYAHQFYGKEQVTRNIVAAITNSNVLTCATRGLLDEFGKVPGERIKAVIPNACPIGYYRPYQEKHGKSFRIGWRGGKTHDEDIYTHLEAFDLLLSKNNKYHFYFFGEPFWMIKRLIPSDRATYIPLQDQYDYFASLHATHLDVLMVPLVDNPFNRAKSNIAYIEGTMAGAHVVAPRLPEWVDLPGCLTYETPREMAMLVHGTYDTPFSTKSAHDYVMKNLQLDFINKKRWQICSAIARI